MGLIDCVCNQNGPNTLSRRLAEPSPQAKPLVLPSLLPHPVAPAPTCALAATTHRRPPSPSTCTLCDQFAPSLSFSRDSSSLPPQPELDTPRQIAMPASAPPPAEPPQPSPPAPTVRIAPLASDIACEDLLLPCPPS
jgi:hypothetical protein